MAGDDSDKNLNKNIMREGLMFLMFLMFFPSPPARLPASGARGDGNGARPCPT
jgi:hypothetical protein